MNRVLLFRHPLHALLVLNPKLPLSPFFQAFPFRRRRDLNVMMNFYRRSISIFTLVVFFFFYHFCFPSPCLTFSMNSEIRKDQPEVSSFPSFTTSCTTNENLSTKKCVPCNTMDLRPMTQDAAHTLIRQVAQWNLVNQGGLLKLRRSWKVKTFTKGLEFFRIIADLAEAEGHHPDLHLVGWNNVTIEIWTHAVGGLTENDFILAAKIDGLNLHHLLRHSD